MARIKIVALKNFNVDGKRYNSLDKAEVELTTEWKNLLREGYAKEE